MTDAEALDLCVDRTKHERFAQLLDPNHPDYEPAYKSVVRAIAVNATAVRRTLAITPYTGPLPDCRHASPGLSTSCNVIRCAAHHGSTCGGSHASLDHCSRCPQRIPT